MKAAARKDQQKREQLGLTVVPPTPTTRSYMRRALPPLPGQAKLKGLDYGKEDEENRPPCGERVERVQGQVNQLRGYRIDAPHPLEMNTGRTARRLSCCKEAQKGGERLE